MQVEDLQGAGPPAPATPDSEPKSPPEIPSRRIRLRFAKTGDLRLISHRDLARTFERLFRRAGVPVRMSQGFHPKPKINFPSALALGVVGLDEIVEVQVEGELTAEEVLARVRVTAPEGLELLNATEIAGSEKKPLARAATYEFVLPERHREGAAAAVRSLLAHEQLLIQRDGKKPMDLRAMVDSLELDGDVLRMRLRITPQSAIRPREVLEALGIAPEEQTGQALTRTAVELEP